MSAIPEWVQIGHEAVVRHYQRTGDVRPGHRFKYRIAAGDLGLHGARSAFSGQIGGTGNGTAVQFKSSFLQASH